MNQGQEGSVSVGQNQFKLPIISRGEQLELQEQFEGDNEIPDFNPLYWHKLEKESGAILGEDSWKFIHFCQDVVHLGISVVKHVIQIFMRAAEKGMHYRALERLTEFFENHNLWLRNAEDLKAAFNKEPEDLFTEIAEIALQP